MSYTPLRIDFVAPGTACARPSSNQAQHGLPTGIAIIMLDQATGLEEPFGPCCAVAALQGQKSLLKGLPNFTARDFSNGPTRVANPANLIPNISPTANVQRPQAEAIRYMILRLNKIANLPAISTSNKSALQLPWLLGVYNNYQISGQVSPQDVSSIGNLMKNAPALYQPNRLLDVYTAYTQLSRKLAGAPPKSIPFFQSLLGQLQQNFTLTKKQISAADLKLHPKPF